jgi:hypothetical protein
MPKANVYDITTGKLCSTTRRRGPRPVLPPPVPAPPASSRPYAHSAAALALIDIGMRLAAMRSAPVAKRPTHLRLVSDS